MADYTITSDQQQIDVDAAHAFLATTYWSPGVARDVVARAIANSLCFAVRHGDRQVGFARVITDKATFAYLSDVYVLPEHRGNGLSKRMLAAIGAHPELQGLRRKLLVTRDAHGLYAQFGFKSVAHPDRFMESVAPTPHRQDP